jgi:hypothetical protein
MLHTWEPVSIELSNFNYWELQSLMLLSVVPPPVTNKLCLWGDHANPFTAAVWWSNLAIYLFIFEDHITTELSLPPEARKLSSKDHFTPQTYCLCP